MAHSVSAAYFDNTLWTIVNVATAQQTYLEDRY